MPPLKQSDQFLDTSFDSLFEGSIKEGSGLTWLPWVGKNFKNRKHKILIIAESHYSDEVNPEKAIEDIAKWLEKKPDTRCCNWMSHKWWLVKHNIFQFTQSYTWNNWIRNIRALAGNCILQFYPETNAVSKWLQRTSVIHRLPFRMENIFNRNWYIEAITVHFRWCGCIQFFQSSIWRFGHSPFNNVLGRAIEQCL